MKQPGLSRGAPVRTAIRATSSHGDLFLEDWYHSDYQPAVRLRAHVVVGHPKRHWKRARASDLENLESVTVIFTDMNGYQSDMHGCAPQRTNIYDCFLYWPYYWALTDDWMSRHGLANHGSIAAQKNGNRGTVLSAVQLRYFIYSASVEGAILSAPCRI